MTILGAGLVAVACGSDDKPSDGNGIGGGSGGTSSGEGGASASVDDQVKDLQDKIKALEALLADTTNADAIASLEGQIKDLNDQLTELTAPKCGLGGDCVGFPTSTESLAPILEAVCSHLDNCCSTSLISAGLGSSVTNAAECTTALTDRYARDLEETTDDFYLELPFLVDLPELPALAAAVERGSVELNADGIAACVATIEKAGCGDSPTSDLCEAPEGEYACEADNLYDGQLTEGALCEPSSVHECADGLWCDGESGAAICRKNNPIGGSCFNDSGCSEGYCDALTDTCVAFAQEGETCSFEDPQGLFPPNREVQRCESGLSCSILTKTCISNCSRDEGFNCNSNNECGADFYCDREVYESGPGRWADDYSYYGACAAKLAVGEACGSDSQCESGDCDSGDTGLCLAPPVDDSCDTNADCESGEYCNGSSCETKRADGIECGGYSLDGDDDSVCQGGLCTSGVCNSAQSTGGDCYAYNNRESMIDGSRACPDTDYCSEDLEICVTKLAIGADCGSLSDAEADIACGDGNYCDSLGQCAVRAIPRGGDCSNGGSQTVYEDPTHRGCAEGLICAGYDPDGGGADPEVYVCLPPRDAEGARAEGEYCGPNQNAQSSARCENNRCRMVEGKQYAVCDAGVPEGDPCDASKSFGMRPGLRPYHDQCQDGFYCRVTDVYDSPDGVCTQLVPHGGLCDVTQLPSHLQCEGYQECTEYNGLARCAPEFNDEDDGNMCPIVWVFD